MRGRALGFILALMAVTAPAMAKERGVPLAITVDDLPAHGPLPPGVSRLDIARETIRALKAAGVIASGFVNGSFGAEEADAPRVLDAWRAARLPLGNHGFSHLNLDEVGAAAFIADLDRNEALVTGQPRRFRYPFLAEGRDPAARDAVRTALAARHYTIAAVTMSFDDYAYNAPYVRCLAQGDADAVRALEVRYLASARADGQRARAISRAVLGREVPQVLLLHIGAFGARMLPRLLDQYRADGFRFVSLDKAQADGFYAATDPAMPGPSPTMEAVARQMAVPPPARPAIPGDEICPAE